MLLVWYSWCWFSLFCVLMMLLKFISSWLCLFLVGACRFFGVMLTVIRWWCLVVLWHVLILVAQVLGGLMFFSLVFCFAFWTCFLKHISWSHVVFLHNLHDFFVCVLFSFMFFRFPRFPPVVFCSRRSQLTEDARPIFRRLNGLEALQKAVEAPESFLEELGQKEDEMLGLLWAFGIQMFIYRCCFVLCFFFVFFWPGKVSLW